MQVDLELVPAGDRTRLVDFAARLRAALPRTATLSIAVPAHTDQAGYDGDAYDLAALSRTVDAMTLMAYDQHGPTWSGPGPVGGLAWQTAALRVVLRSVPAEEVDLGVAGYGYTWPASGRGSMVSDARARALAARDDATARWDAAQGEWTATQRDGTVLWWSDARSWPLRVQLASQLHLHGLALWSLGTADPLPAPA